MLLGMSDEEYDDQNYEEQAWVGSDDEDDEMVDENEFTEFMNLQKRLSKKNQQPTVQIA
jgi:hypothetical protein